MVIKSIKCEKKLRVFFIRNFDYLISVYKTAILGTLAMYIYFSFYILHFAWFCLQNHNRYKATAKSQEKRTKLYNKVYLISNTY
jgi:hypothetical protein